MMKRLGNSISFKRFCVILKPEFEGDKTLASNFMTVLVFLNKVQKKIIGRELRLALGRPYDWSDTLLASSSI